MGPPTLTFPVSCRATKTTGLSILATSPTVIGNEKVVLFHGNSRDWLSDRKTLLEHLRLGALFISTVRVTLLQGSQALANLLKDQIEVEKGREELVSKGKMTAYEADNDNLEWERREWKTLWKTLPRKIIHGIVRFHSITLVMRVYEWSFAKGLSISNETMDKLTKDVFKSAIRKRNRLDTGNGKFDKRQMISAMFRTCLWANAVSFLADFTVYQSILIYGYYSYHRRKKKCSAQNDVVGSTNENLGMLEEPFMQKNDKYALCFIISKLAKTTILRSFAFLVASASGAIGSAMYPGWGTLFGTQVGDSAISVFY